MASASSVPMDELGMEPVARFGVLAYKCILHESDVTYWRDRPIDVKSALEADGLVENDQYLDSDDDGNEGSESDLDNPAEIAVASCERFNMLPPELHRFETELQQSMYPAIAFGVSLEPAHGQCLHSDHFTSERLGHSRRNPSQPISIGIVITAGDLIGTFGHEDPVLRMAFLSYASMPGIVFYLSLPSDIATTRSREIRCFIYGNSIKVNGDGNRVRMGFRISHTGDKNSLIDIRGKLPDFLYDERDKLGTDELHITKTSIAGHDISDSNAPIYEVTRVRPVWTGIGDPELESYAGKLSIAQASQLSRIELAIAFLYKMTKVET